MHAEFSRRTLTHCKINGVTGQTNFPQKCVHSFPVRKAAPHGSMKAKAQFPVDAAPLHYSTGLNADLGARL